MLKFCAAAIAAFACLAVPAVAHPPIVAEAAEARAALEADRADILAMAGNFRVRFDMQEATAWKAGYEPLERKISGGYEVVRVIEDTRTRIVLQHLLVVGEDQIVKHWRQDWEYEPARILAYQGDGVWRWEDVPERMRAGRWSQTVYQVDDSPRYAGWGQFETQSGVRRWRSGWTMRPLARRDAIRNPVYDRYQSINRHQPAPDGWIHWQDNTKIAVSDGVVEPIVQEYVLNTYTRFDGFKVAAAEEYWSKTQEFWAAVRATWTEVATRKAGIAIEEEAQVGTVISARLLSLGDKVAAGEISEADAIAEARRLIGDNTRDLSKG
jgi:hypothetical protein